MPTYKGTKQLGPSTMAKVSGKLNRFNTSIKNMNAERDRAFDAKIIARNNAKKMDSEHSDYKTTARRK